jgi:ribA/ribD-fused uncharacterized protein
MVTDITTFQGEHRFLSNFYPAVVVLDGTRYPTVENAFQAAKTETPLERLPFVVVKPGEAKRLGRKLKLRRGWDLQRVDVMHNLLRQKFGSGALRLKLLQTGDRRLVEGNTWHDNYWGSCVCCGPGNNWLGRLLETVRDELLREESA